MILKMKGIINCFNFKYRATTERCEHDLKQTLSKDIRKRICETYAFYLYDKWWQEQEEKYKSKVRISNTELISKQILVGKYIRFTMFDLSSCKINLFDCILAIWIFLVSFKEEG